MSFELSSLAPSEIALLPRDSTAIFICLGPIEDHGSHLPIGLDLYEAEGFAKMVAGQIEGKFPDWKIGFLPVIAMGIESNTSRLAIRVRAHVLRDYLLDTCQCLYQQGFRNFVCFSGHTGPKQLTAIEEAGKLLRKKNKSWFKRGPLPSLVSAQSVTLDPAETSSFPVWMDPSEHGGKRDTSMALMIVPEKMQEHWKTLPEILKQGSLLDRFLKYRKKEMQDYWGTPAMASREEGARLIQEKIDILVPKLRAVWEGARSDHVFKSWYSVYPTNWSLFRIWVLVTILLLILGAWLSMAFQAMLAGSLT